MIQLYFIYSRFKQHIFDGVYLVFLQGFWSIFIRFFGIIHVVGQFAPISINVTKTIKNIPR